MHIGRNYSLKELLLWTRRYIYIFIVISSIPVLLYELLDHVWIAIPWLPIALVGTAVAFIVTFKNNASYDRMWEARKIWGEIVNGSRSWANMVNDFVTNEFAKDPIAEAQLFEIKKQLIYRHVAWLTALRHQLRQPKPWESHEVKSDKELRSNYPVPEYLTSLEDDINPYLSDQEKDFIWSKDNRAMHIISLQSAALKEMKLRGLIDNFRHMQMQKMLTAFYTQQGRSERIKNFPYPRQYATINRYFVWLFIILVPFGMMTEFMNLGLHTAWLSIPFSTIVAWVFHTMERIGDTSENPFEGGPNDIPISSMCRNIEIEIRQILGEEELPLPLQPKNSVML